MDYFESVAYRDHIVKQPTHIDQNQQTKNNRDVDAIPNITKKALGDLKKALDSEATLAKLYIKVGPIATAITVAMVVAGIFVPAVGGLVLLAVGIPLAVLATSMTGVSAWYNNKIQSIFSKMEKVQENSQNLSKENIAEKRVKLAEDSDQQIKSILNEVKNLYGKSCTIGFFRDLDESVQRKHLKDYPELATELADWCYKKNIDHQVITNQTRPILDLLYETKDDYTPECRKIILQARLPRFISKFSKELESKTGKSEDSKFAIEKYAQYGPISPEDERVFYNFLETFDVTAKNIDALKRIADDFELKELKQDLDVLKIFHDARG